MRERHRATWKGLLILLGFGIGGCGAGAVGAPLSSPLALDVAIEAITADLRRFIPEQIDREGVAGLSIALVRDRQIVWAEGFGATNSLTRQPVTADTIFEVASHSKVVTAYTALRLVGQRELLLDAPLSRYLTDPFLPASPEREAVTLRRVLTHTSGLSNLLAGVYSDTRIWFPPGDRFSYSGHGFEYLGAVIENLTGRPFESYVVSTVLDDLGMHSSGYAVDETMRERHAKPHLSAPNLLSVFVLCWLLAGGLTAGVTWLVMRLRVHRPSWSWRRVRSVLVVSLIFAAGAFVAVMRAAGFPPSAIALLPVGAGLLFLLVAFRLFAGLLRATRGGWLCAAGIAGGVALASFLVVLMFVASRPALPLPLRSFDFAPAGGLRATASDLARLMIELMAPRNIDPGLIRQMLAPQVRVSERVSWGLGIGLQHGPHGNSFWHWGLNPGYESLMVGYPEQGIGVVVLTNGGPGGAGLRVARRVAHRAIGGDHYGYWNDVPGAFWPAGPNGSPAPDRGR